MANLETASESTPNKTDSMEDRQAVKNEVRSAQTEFTKKGFRWLL
jgi:hypothetical protein